MGASALPVIGQVERVSSQPPSRDSPATHDFVDFEGPTDDKPCHEIGVVRLQETDERRTRLGLLRTEDSDLSGGSHVDDCVVDTPGEESSGTTAADAAKPLPFEDPKLAEKILEMEIDGVIDDGWQNAARAAKEDVAELCRILREMRVRDIVAIDTSKKTAAFDYIIFGTCEGSRHIALAAWAVSEADREKRISKPSRRKTDDLWDVVTCGRILINLMQHSYRETLSLERKWALTAQQDLKHAARAAVSEGRIAQVHGLWTLTVNLQDLEDFEVDYCKDILLDQK